VDIYTVSKLLGHKHIASTERYAHAIEKLKASPMTLPIRPNAILAHCSAQNPDTTRLRAKNPTHNPPNHPADRILLNIQQSIHQFLKYICKK
jgi:hypothetical protein